MSAIEPFIDTTSTTYFVAPAARAGAYSHSQVRCRDGRGERGPDSRTGFRDDDGGDANSAEAA